MISSPAKMKDDTITRLDGSEGELISRRLVVWRRLEDGDARTAGTELAPENPLIEAKVVTVGISKELHEDLTRLWEKRQSVTSIGRGWNTRYEPAGLIFTLGASAALVAWLGFLPADLILYALGVATIGFALGLYTRTMRARLEAKADAAWKALPERKEAEKIEKTLKPRWERFLVRLREESGFRGEIRIDANHEAERLSSLDAAALTDPTTWLPDEGKNDVRYCWMYRDGRLVEQQAELEDVDKSEKKEKKVESEDE